jgi:hypothetical protein
MDMGQLPSAIEGKTKGFWYRHWLVGLRKLQNWG